MARISTYGQDGTPNKQDKVLGTDSATGGTKNYSVESLLTLANAESLVDLFDGSTFQFQDYVAAGANPEGVVNLNAGTASTTAFSAINQIYISVLDRTGLSVSEFIQNMENDFIKISEKGNVNQFGIFEVTAIADHDGGAYKLLTVTPRGSNGDLTPGDPLFVSNYAALYDQDFSDDSVTEFGDVTLAGSGAIITVAERNSLNNFTNNGLVDADIVNNLITEAPNTVLSGAQGKVLKDLIDTINALLLSDNVDLDSLQEVVDFIEANKTSLDNLSISNISGLSAALSAKEDSVLNKGLSSQDFTTLLKQKLDGIEALAQANVQANWSSTAGDSLILNKPADLTNLALHTAAELSDLNNVGSGDIITSAERTKLTNLVLGAEANVQADWNATTGDAQILNKPLLAPSTAEENVQSNWDEADNTSDAFIQNKPSVALSTTTIQAIGTANEIVVDPTTAQDLSANRTITIGLPDSVAITNNLSAQNLKPLNTIEFEGLQPETPAFNNGLYFKDDDGQDTLHFRYNGGDVSIDNFTEILPTGILNGGNLSKANNTQFSIQAGNGIVNDLNKGASTNPHPQIIDVSWPTQTITVSNLNPGSLSQLNSWIYINSDGLINQQPGAFTDAQWRTAIPIGVAVHSNGIVSFTRTFPRTAYNQMTQHADFVSAFGALKKSGHVISANGVNLSLNRSAGVAFALGRNYITDPENPSTVIDSSKEIAAIHKYYSDGGSDFIRDTNAGAGYTVISPNLYDNGSGTLQTVINSKFTAQRMYYFPGTSDIIVSYYGKNVYDSIDETMSNYLLEDFIEAGNTADQAIYVGALIVKGNATDLSNPLEARFLTAGTFRSLAATNVGGVAADAVLGDLGDVEVAGPLNGQVLKYNSLTTKWENQADAGGIQLTDLSVGDEGVAAGDGDISYDNTTGIFTYSPPDLSAYIDGAGTAGNLPKFSDADTLTDSAISEQAGVTVTLSLTGAVFTTGGGTLTLDNSNGGVNPLGGWSVGETFTIGYDIQTNNGGFDFGAGGIVVTITSATATGFTGSQFDIFPGETATYVSGGFTYSGSAGTTPSKIGINKAVPNVSLDINGTDSVQMPSGTTAERPAGTNGMFRYNTEDSQFEGYTDGAWGAIAGGGSGGTIVKKTFSGDGSNRDFLLDNAIVAKSNVDVYVNGVYQFPSNYEVSGSTVTFDTDAIPSTGTENVSITHVVGVIATEGSSMQKTSFTGDGTTTTFALGDTPQAKSFTIVHVQGIYQESSAYSVSGSNIVFTDPVPNGYTAEVTFIAGTISIASLDVGSQTINSFVGNGTNTFDLGENALADKNYTDVYINGVYQSKSQYELAGPNIVFDTAPQIGYDIEVKGHSASAGNVTNSTSMTSDVFTADGLTSTFALVNGSPSSKEFTMVFISGIYQQKTAYSLISNQIIFAGENPAEDDTIEVITLSTLNNISSPVTSVNGLAGNVVIEIPEAKHDVSIISSDTTAVTNTLYVFTANLNLTLPALPISGDSIKISNRSAVATCQLLRNGNNILGGTDDLTLDTPSASFELIYTDAANGWVIIGQ